MKTDTAEQLPQSAITVKAHRHLITFHVHSCTFQGTYHDMGTVKDVMSKPEHKG